MCSSSKIQTSFANPYEDYEFGFKFGTQFDIIKKKLLSLIELILNHQTTEDEACDGGLYSGLGGIAYMLVHLLRTPDVLAPSEKIKIIPRVQKFLNVQLNYFAKLRDLASSQDSNETDECSYRVGLLLGEAGVFAVGAVLAHFLGNEKTQAQCLREFVIAGDTAKQINEDFDGKGSTDICTGRAGYLCSALWLNQHLGYQPVPVEILQSVWKAIIHSGRLEARKKKIKHYPLSFSCNGQDFIGALHGASSILFVLLSWPQFLDNDEMAERDIRATLDYLYQMLGEFQTGYFPATMKEVSEVRKSKKRNETGGDSTNEIHPLQWCHGMPGLAYLFAKAGIRYKNHEYLKCCVKIANTVWVHGLTTKGLSLCHGIAGNAYLFLLVYRLTEFDARFLYRALRFAEFMFTKECQEISPLPENHYSLFEGLAGTVCFLSDLLRSEHAEFPFFNVFFDADVSTVPPPLLVAMVPSSGQVATASVIADSDPPLCGPSGRKSKLTSVATALRDASLPLSVLVPCVNKSFPSGERVSKLMTPFESPNGSGMVRTELEDENVLMPAVKVEVEDKDESSNDYTEEDTHYDKEMIFTTDLLEVELHENVQIKTERLSPVDEEMVPRP